MSNVTILRFSTKLKKNSNFMNCRPQFYRFIAFIFIRQQCKKHHLRSHASSHMDVVTNWNMKTEVNKSVFNILLHPGIQFRHAAERIFIPDRDMQSQTAHALA